MNLDETYKYETIIFLCKKYGLNIKFDNINTLEDKTIYVKYENNIYNIYLIMNKELTFFNKYHNADELASNLFTKVLYLNKENRKNIIKDYMNATHNKDMEGLENYMTNSEYEEMYKYETFMYLCTKYNLDICFNEEKENKLCIFKKDEYYESVFKTNDKTIYNKYFTDVDVMVKITINDYSMNEEDKNKFMEDYTYTVSKENIEGRNK